MDSQASKKDLHLRLLLLAIMGCCLLVGAGYFVVFTPTGDDVQRAAASAEKLRAVLAAEGLPVTHETNEVMFHPTRWKTRIGVRKPHPNAEKVCELASKHRSEIATTASFILTFYDGRDARYAREKHSMNSPIPFRRNPPQVPTQSVEPQPLGHSRTASKNAARDRYRRDRGQHESPPPAPGGSPCARVPQSRRHHPGCGMATTPASFGHAFLRRLHGAGGIHVRIPLARIRLGVFRGWRGAVRKN